MICKHCGSPQKVEEKECPVCHDGCKQCENNKKGSGITPTHNGSRYCQSGSIASGGKNAHCTCDLCF